MELLTREQINEIRIAIRKGNAIGVGLPHLCNQASRAIDLQDENKQLKEQVQRLSAGVDEQVGVACEELLEDIAKLTIGYKQLKAKLAEIEAECRQRVKIGERDWFRDDLVNGVKDRILEILRGGEQHDK
jgi:peptidoglycan hydrolase CwlO-like protein